MQWEIAQKIGTRTLETCYFFMNPTLVNKYAVLINSVVGMPMPPGLLEQKGSILKRNHVCATNYKNKCLLVSVLYVNFFCPFLRLLPPEVCLWDTLPTFLDQVLKGKLLGNEKPRNLQISWKSRIHQVADRICIEIDL